MNEMVSVICFKIRQAHGLKDEKIGHELINC